MMESSDLDFHHHHHHHHQEVLPGSSLAAAPSFHGVAGNHGWNQNLMLNCGDLFLSNANGVNPNPRDFRLSHEIPAPPLPLATQVVPDLGFQWAANAGSFMNQSAHQHQLHQAKIKEELPDSYQKLSQVVKDPSTVEDCSQIDEKLLLRTLALDYHNNGLQPPVGDLLLETPNLASFGGGRGSFSMVLPTTNISGLSSPSSSFPCSLGVDLQALDLLSSARFGRSFSQPSLNSIAFLRESMPYGLGHLQEAAQGPSHNHYKMPPLVRGVTEAKRSISIMENKASQTAPKKSRFESRSSFSPFKVRKEKLGDRIAALQQLVAPFGKTDTASVLMEAIGYIKFLQDQVETLSVPYMRSSGNKKSRTTQGASNEERSEPKPDLRSRGLCLVPLSCTSYVTSEHGTVWSPPNYGGGA